MNLEYSIKLDIRTNEWLLLIRNLKVGYDWELYYKGTIEGVIEHIKILEGEE